MAEFPQKIALSTELAEKLRTIGNQEAAFRAASAALAEQMERRAGAIGQETRSVWAEVANAYGLDLRRVEYRLDDDGNTLIPVQVTLA